VKQTVVRTGTKEKGYSYNRKSYEHLEKYLNDGFIVVMCNSIGDELEYILQKSID